MARERVLSGARPLLERDRQLAEVDACIAAAAGERGSSLVLEGRAGMGKSSLLAEARRRATAAGFVACLARASELEGEFAFGVVRQLFEPAVVGLGTEERARAFEGAAALAQPVFDIGSLPAAGGQFAVLHGLYWLAANLSAGKPLLLAVDDAHWADTASLRWLAYMLNRLEGLPIVVAIATRPPRSTPQGELLASILAEADVRILPVGPLGQSSVAALVQTALGAVPDPLFTSACLEATAGNPLGLNELLRDLRNGGVAPTDAAAADLGRRAPDAIARRVLRDLRLLGDEAERLAGALAVIGDGTDLRLIAPLADLEVDRAEEMAEALLAVDLIAPERPLRFAHPLLRAAVYDRLPEASRQMLHRQAAELLRSHGAQPESVAAHLLRCQAAVSPEMINSLRAAAPLALRRGAPEAAIAYLRRAVAEEAPPEVRAPVLADLGRAEVTAGDPAAVDHLQEALAGTTNQRARAAILSDLYLGIILQTSPRIRVALQDDILSELRDCDPGASARLECIAAGIEMGSTDPGVASAVDRHLPRLRELSRGTTPDAGLARVTLTSLVSWRYGNRDEALTWIGDGSEWRVVSERSSLRSLSIAWSIMALLGVDELDRAARWCETVMREAAAEGSLATVLTGMAQKAYAESQMGLLAEAQADATAAFEMSQQHFPYWVPIAGTYLAQILFERGRCQAAYETIESITIGPGIAGGMVEATVRDLRGLLRCARGWRERGLEDLRAAGRLCEALGLRNPIIWPWRASLATALAGDGRDEARRLALENLSNARRSGLPRAIGVALRTLAVVDRDNSIDLLRASVAAVERAPAPLDLARSLADLGAALRRQGHRVEAREPLREALEIAARCGAVPLMERAQAEAVAAGARPRRPRLRGVDALTPSELRVARLAAEGRSNREIAQALFITTNTVADHLGSAYGKLDIASRGQLAAALERSTP